MNSLIGKSTGIALLMAAALLAALFATGVFSPMAAEAGVKGTPKPTATLTKDGEAVTLPRTAGVTLTVTFETNDDIDGAPGNDVVDVNLSSGIAEIAATFPTGNISVTQGGQPVGSVSVTGPQNIRIGEPPEGGSVVRAGMVTTLTVSGLTLGDAAVSGFVGISQGTATLPNAGDENAQQRVPIAIYNPANALTGQSVSLSNDNTGAANVSMTIKFTPNAGSATVITLPKEYDAKSADNTELVSVTAGAASITHNASGDTLSIAANTLTADTEYTITLGPGDNNSPVGFTNPAEAGTFKVKIREGNVIPAQEASFTTKKPMKVSLSSAVPSASVQITIKDTAGVQMVSGDDLQVDLTDTGFGVPSTIATSGINIVSTDTVTTTSVGDVIGSPSNVTVTGSKVSLTIPYGKSTAGNDESRTIKAKQMYTITFKQSAGITNPAAAGEKTIKWVEDAPNSNDAAKKDDTVDIQRVIKLSKKSGARGTMTTASLLGFANGTATVYLNAADLVAPKTMVDYKLAEVTVADNVGTLEIDTTPKKFSTGRTDADKKAIGNEITAVDARGAAQHVAAMFTISPALAVDPAESPVSKEVEIKLSDWPVDEPITKVEIGATELDATTHKVPAAAAAAENPWGKTTPDGDKAPGTLTIKVLIPADTNRGTQSVKVTGTNAPDATKPKVLYTARADLKIGVLDLTVQPAMAVPGQVITVQGSGFEAGDTVTTVTVGGQAAIVRESNGTVTVNTAGDFIATVKVPSSTESAIGTGKKTVSVATASGSGRVAEGSVEIPEAAIELDPVESRRGTTVTLSGTGFPAATVVQVAYGKGGSTIAAGTTDASGVISMTFVVPGTAGIGAEHEVTATSVAATGGYAAVSAKATHDTPGATFTLSASEVQRGGSLTISGMNFPAYSAVSSIMIGETEVAPSPSPTTSNDGDFTTTVTVPGLSVGNYTVKVNAGGTVVAKSIAIVEAVVVVSTDPADVFASLIEAGVLNRVFHYDNATQEWTLYDPDPAFAEFNDLTSVSSGDIVWVNLTAAATFQGQDLKEGWSLVSIN